MAQFCTFEFDHQSWCCLHGSWSAPRPHDLIAVGTAYHSFTQPARTHLALDPIDARRSTTVLNKQVARLLVEDRPLALIAAPVTDPLRPALANGTTAWSDAVERASLGRRATMLLLRDPESAADADLRAVLGLGRRTPPGTLAGDARAGT